MKRYIWLCIPLAIASLWLGGGGRLTAVFYDAFRDLLSGGAIAVRAAQVKRSAITIVVRGSGELEPVKTVDIASPLAGTLGQLHVKVGDAVKGGQVVATIRAGEIVERAEKSELSLRLAEAALKKSDEQLAGALKRLEIARELHAKDLIARNDLIAAKASAAAASAAHDLAQAQLMRQAAELAQLRQLLTLSNLVAPFTGVVTRRWVEPGGQVQSAAPVLTIAAPDSFKIIIRIPAKYLPSIPKGLAARVELKDLPGPALTGKVVNAHPDTNIGGDAAVVEIHPANAEFMLRSGLPASVTLRLNDTREALAVPKQALVERDGRTFLYAIVDGKARRRPVVTGESQDEMVEITSGIAEGEKIIVAGPRTMEQGLRVRVLKDVKDLR